MNINPRMLFVFSSLFANLISRSLPGSIGKPQTWFLPKNWM